VVLDTSPTMADDVTRLQSTFEEMADTYAARCMDVRVGVTTADMSAGGAQGQLLGDDANPPVLDSLATSGFREKLLQKLAQPLTSTAPSWPLAAAAQAFSEPLQSGANAGFRRRANTPLSVLIFTDREDSSPGSVADSVNALATSLPEAPHLLSVSSFSGTEGAATCGASPAPRLLEAASLTDGVQESICTPDTGFVVDPCWSYSWGATFHLTSNKDAAWPLEVSIDGVPVPESTESGETVWRYDATTNSLTFSTAYAPQPGTTLTITYRTRCSED
jgi:hypothetical protein